MLEFLAMLARRWRIVIADDAPGRRGSRWDHVRDDTELPGQYSALRCPGLGGQCDRAQFGGELFLTAREVLPRPRAQSAGAQSGDRGLGSIRPLRAGEAHRGAGLAEHRLDRGLRRRLLAQLEQPRSRTWWRPTSPVSSRSSTALATIGRRRSGSALPAPRSRRQIPGRPFLPESHPGLLIGLLLGLGWRRSEKRSTCRSRTSTTCSGGGLPTLAQVPTNPQVGAPLIGSSATIHLGGVIP